MIMTYMIPILALLLPIAIGLILYFVVIKKKMCDGDLYECPKSNVSICVQSGTSNDDSKKMCDRLTAPTSLTIGRDYINSCIEEDGCLSGPEGCNSQACLNSIKRITDPKNKDYRPGCDFKTRDIGCANAKECQNLWCNGRSPMMIVDE